MAEQTCLADSLYSAEDEEEQPVFARNKPKRGSLDRMHEVLPHYTVELRVIDAVIREKLLCPLLEAKPLVLYVRIVRYPTKSFFSQFICLIFKHLLN